MPGGWEWRSIWIKSRWVNQSTAMTAYSSPNPTPAFWLRWHRRISERFEEAMGEVIFAAIGEVTKADRLEVYGIKGEKVVSTPLAELKEAWQKPLRW